MNIAEKYSVNKIEAIYQDLRNERSEWESDWRDISSYLLPGRGIYQTYSKPRKRKLTTSNVINTIGEDALQILTSGMHGRLTSPAMPWFRLNWADDQLDEVEPLVAWLQESEDILQGALHKSSFYSMINSFYLEYAGFGTSCNYVGEDTGDDAIPFRFELLTAGEYAFALGPTGDVDIFARTIFMSPRQLTEKFPDTVDKDTKARVERNDAGVDRVELAIIEFVAKEAWQDKNYVRLFYEVTSSGKRYSDGKQAPLQVDGFYEHPYPVARWGTIGSDTYGIGPGSRALPDIKRLQEMEKAFLMATHKGINPPLNAPSRMRGKINSLPGGLNYYSNPSETVNELYKVNFDYQGVSAAVERVEQRIQKNFYNDVFLTAARDPNSSPLKAAQVNAQEQEKLLRLGPVVERLQAEYFTKLLTRCFNILKRKEWLPPLDPALEDLAGDFEIELISPMAVAQKSVKSQGVDAFMGFLGQAAQFDETILDNLDPDAAARDRAEVEGVNLGILRTQEEVEMIRAQRAEAQQAAMQAEQEQRARDEAQYMETEGAANRKMNAEAGKLLTDTQVTAKEAGLLQ